MKNVRKNLLKAMMLIALFAPAAFADGDMGGGGLADPGNTTKDGKVLITRSNENVGDMGGVKTSDEGFVGSLMDALYDYFDFM
jgi:hypothetical protein